MSKDLQDKMDKGRELEDLKNSVKKAITKYQKQRYLIDRSLRYLYPQNYSEKSKELAEELRESRETLWRSAVDLKRVYDRKIERGDEDKDNVDEILTILGAAAKELKKQPITKSMNYDEVVGESPGSYDLGQDAHYPSTPITQTVEVFGDFTQALNYQMQEQGEAFSKSLEKTFKEKPLIKTLEKYSKESAILAEDNFSNPESNNARENQINKVRKGQIKEISADLEFIKEHPPRIRIGGEMVVDEEALAKLIRGCLLKHKEKSGARQNSSLGIILDRILSKEGIRQEANGNQKQDQAAYNDFRQQHDLYELNRVHELNRNELNNFNKLQIQVEKTQKKCETLLKEVNQASGGKRKNAIKNLLESRALLLKNSTRLNEKIRKQPKFYSPETQVLLENVAKTLEDVVKTLGETNESEVLNKSMAAETKIFKKKVNNTIEYVVADARQSQPQKKDGKTPILKMLEKYTAEHYLEAEYGKKKNAPGSFITLFHKKIDAENEAKLNSIREDLKLIKKASLDVQPSLIRGCLLDHKDKTNNPALKKMLTDMLEEPAIKCKSNANQKREDTMKYTDFMKLKRDTPKSEEDQPLKPLPKDSSGGSRSSHIF